MKRQEKLQLIESAIRNIDLCRCCFSYEDNYFYYYPNIVNEKFLLAQEEDDFILDGYCIRKISQLKKIEIKDDKCNEINRINGLTTQIKTPNIDISSWQTIFLSLISLDNIVIIEDEISGDFAIGKIQKVLKNKLYFLEFNADGVWSDSELVIPYSTITSVSWNTRYTNTWNNYLNSRIK